jgi:antitoxin (DNA-binding transcriptional repressor) of toxin-antitoxin stability system
MKMANEAVATIGIGDLGERGREVVQRVREHGEIVDIADDGTIVARIVPIANTVDREALAEWWKRHEELVEEIDQHWPEGVSAADAIADVRRDL